LVYQIVGDLETSFFSNFEAVIGGICKEKNVGSFAVVLGPSFVTSVVWNAIVQAITTLAVSDRDSDQ
jgi:hypothetical protein